MKFIHHEMHTLKPIVFLIIAILLVSGCSGINELGVKTNTIKKSSSHYKLEFKKRDYSSYLLNFIPQKDQFILSTVDTVYIVDLKTGAVINHLKIPDSSSIVESTYVSKNGANFFQFTPDDMQMWNTTNWTLSKKLKSGKHPNRLSGFSKDEGLLYFAGTLWTGKTFKRLIEFNDSPVPNGYDFSPDGQYFISPNHIGGISIIDIKNKKWSGITYSKNGASQVSFRDNNSFYASYGAKLDITKGGYLPEELGLFAVKEKNTLGTFSPSSRISCWVNNPEFGLLVSLYDGDIYLLNHQLDIQLKWHMDDYVRVCSQDNNGNIWLGGNKTGIYMADLEHRVITHEYETNNPISALKVSSDNRHLGITESLPGETLVKVFSLDSKPPH